MEHDLSQASSRFTKSWLISCSFADGKSNEYNLLKSIKVSVVMSAFAFSLWKELKEMWKQICGELMILFFLVGEQETHVSLLQHCL